MNKKILIAAIAIVIIAIIAFAFLKTDFKQEETEEASQQKKEEEPFSALDESVRSMIEELKPTCFDFLRGDLSGDPNFDCPGFDNPINKNLCFYCYAVKNENSELCEKIENDYAFKVICQRATGVSIEEAIVNQ